ncbi:hypothetical protein [Streptomyces bobili]|uniref:hypothetical protein n=1 Tax=Streptomyces bobili TaxID=67280 RepID=UPI00372132C2
MTNEHPDADENMAMTELYFGNVPGVEETDCGLTVLREFRAFRDGGGPFPSYSDEELEERWAQVLAETEVPAGEEPAGSDGPKVGDSRDRPADAAPGADPADDGSRRADTDGRTSEGVLVGEVHEVWFVPRDNTGWHQYREAWHERFELDLMTADGSSAAVLEARAPRAPNAAQDHWFLQLKCTMSVTATPRYEGRVTSDGGWLKNLKRARRMPASEPELLFVVMLPCSITFTAPDRAARAWSTPPPLDDDIGAEENIRLPVPAAVLCVAHQSETKWQTGSVDAAFLTLPERLFPVREHLPDLRAYWRSTLHHRLPERLKLPCRE